MNSDRLDDLWDRYQQGAATDAEVVELEELLWSDKAMRRQLVEHALLEVQLRKAYATNMPLRPARRAAIRKFRPAPYGIAAAVLMLLVVGALFWFANSRKSNDGSASASVVVNGQVKIDGGAVTRIPANVPFEVVGGTATIRLSDGSIVELSRGTKASVRGREDDARQAVVLSEGSGKFGVSHGGGKFRVETPAGTVTALGTTFTVDLRPHQHRLGKLKKAMLVRVAEGRVRVDAGGKNSVLGAGESFVFADDGEKNQIDNGQQNQNDDGQKNQNDDGQKNQNDDGQQNQRNG